MRIKISNGTVVEVTSLDVKDICNGICNRCNRPEDKRVYIEATLAINGVDVEVYKRECRTLEELKERAIIRFCYNEEIYSCEEAIDDAWGRIHEAYVKGYVDLSDLW